MPVRIVRCVAGMLFVMVGFITLGQTLAVGQGGRRHDDRERGDPGLDRRLAKVLAAAGFTGRIESTLEARLGRPIDPALADLGRLLFFDKILGLHNDNSCAGCHSPAFGFGDSQPMAIGVDNNDVVGPNRGGPRNQRRAPLVANTIFYPALMWTPRFVALSGDPFDPSLGFQFPPPEHVIFGEPTLLAAQGSLPSTELVEMAGFTGITEQLRTLRPPPLPIRRRPRADPAGPRRDWLPQFPHPGRRRRPAQCDSRLPREVRRGLQRRRPPACRWHHHQHAAAGDRRVSDEPHRRQRAAGPVRPRRERGDDTRPEARRPTLLRPGQMRPLPRGRRPIERDVQ